MEASQSRRSGCEGGRAAIAEVAGGGDDSASEVVMPEAIDHDAGRKGVGWVGNPACESDAAIRLGGLAVESGAGLDGG